MNRARHVTDVVTNMKPAPAPAVVVPPANSVEVDAGTIAFLDDLFTRIKGLCPAWRNAWPTRAVEEAAQDEWLAEFIRCRISRDDQVQYGIRMTAQYKKDFVPSVGLFVSWCFSPEALRIPPLDVAYRQAMRNTHHMQIAFARWTHPAIYHAAVAAGFTSLQLLDREMGMKRFAKKYEEQCYRLGRGETLPPAPVAALPEPAGTRTPEVARAALESLRRGIGRKPEEKADE